MEQENKVQCIYCGEVTEPTRDAARDHVLSCHEHPTGIAVRFLRRIAKGEDKAMELANHALFCMTSGREGYVNMRYLS